MIKVQTLRLRGLCASSLLTATSLFWLAACSGAPTDLVDVQTDSAEGAPLTENPGSGASLDDVTNGTADAAQGGQGQDPQRNSTLIQKALENARNSLKLRLFEDARNEAAFVLQLDNDNTEARTILERCQQVLGESAGTPKVFVDLLTIDKVREERERTLVENDLELGNAEMELGNFGRAIDRFERAATALQFSRFVQPNDPLVKEARARLEAAREAKREAERESIQRASQASEAELARMARDREIARELRVERLLDAANVKFQNGEYAASVELVDQALRLDPVNPVATALREVADRARHNTAMDLNRERWRNEWTKTFIELQHSTVPQTETIQFDPGRWSVVSQRKPLSHSQAEELETPQNQAIIKVLNETVTEHNFPEGTTVDQWSNYYQNLTGVTFFIGQDVRDMDAESTALNDFNLSARSIADALKAIRAQTNVGYRVKDGLVQLVEGKSTGTVVLRQYNVTDLLFAAPHKPGPDLRLPTPEDDRPLIPEIDVDPLPSVMEEGRIEELITGTINPDAWGDTFSFAYQQGQVYIRADKETHAKVNQLINELRLHVGIQVDVESRFLRVDDNFLEDVGVDLRGLGNQASQGLSGRGLEKAGNRQNAGFDDFGPRNNANPAVPGEIGTGTEPGIFFDDGEDGDAMARVENLFNTTLGGRQQGLDGSVASGINGGLSNAGGLSLQYAFLDDTEVEVVLRAVSKQERAELIEAPRLLVYNNARGSMHFLREIAYIRDFEVEIAQAAAVANPVIGTVFDGVVLDVHPVVDKDLRFITMSLRPSLMTLQLPIPTFTTTLGVGQPISIQLPEVTLQKVRTTVTVPDGSTMMLGGMRYVERQNLRSTVPLLGSLPGLSWLFTRNGTSVQNRKILILIRSKIIINKEHEPDPKTLPMDDMMTMR